MKRKGWGVLPFSHELARNELGALSDQQLYEGMHVVDADGVIWTGGDAFVSLLRCLGGRATTVVLTQGSSASVGARGLYTFMSRHRGLLARVLPNVSPVVLLAQRETDSTASS